jgi:TolB-like protein/DNA-binding winged helix-turn-helix (wHTH) protein/cytochrome c-type biogenesis protein CcmH/NrfG
MSEKSLQLLKPDNCAHLPRFYEFGVFRVDAEKRLLWRDGTTVALVPKAFDLLLVLVRGHGQVLTKDELMTSVWRDTVVEENSLNVNVSTLRKLLGEKPHEHRFIVTVPGIGYKFVADVEEDPPHANEIVLPEKAANPIASASSDVEGLLPKAQADAKEDEANAHRDPKAAASRRYTMKILACVLIIPALGLLVYGIWPHREVTESQTVKRIAVLPFHSLSADGRNESLEMGMAETLITKLTHVKHIVVTPMNSVRRYVDPNQDPVMIGKELQTEAILDGSIQKAGERIRITVRLRDVQSGAALWADQFDESIIDIFKVQDSISERVIRALKLKLSGEEEKQLAKRSTNDSEAYQLYLQADYLKSQRTNLEKSFEFYQRAIEKDPNFALAYVGVAEYYLHLNSSGKLSAEEAFSKVKPPMMKALELDDTLAEAHNTLAEIKYQYEYDWAGAEQEFRKTLALDPNGARAHLAYGWYLMTAGRFDEALPEMEKARDLDPRSLIYNTAIGRLYYFMRQYDAAIQILKRNLEVAPNSAGDHFALLNAYVQKGMFAEAAQEFTEFMRASGKKAEDIEALKQTFTKSGWRAFNEKVIEQMEARSKNEYVTAGSRAVAYARLGNINQAFSWLEISVNRREPQSLGLKIEPVFDQLRSDDRYRTLLARINLAP